MTNTKGVAGLKPKRIFASALALCQSAPAPLSAFATSLRSGKPVIKASLNTPAFTPWATAR